MMSKQFTAASLRNWADRCATEAVNGKQSDSDIKRLWRMNRALLEMAKTKDWLEGDSGVLVEFVLPAECR